MPRAAKAAAASGLSSAFGALPFAICAITDACCVLRLSCACSYTLKHLAQQSRCRCTLAASVLQAASSLAEIRVKTRARADSRRYLEIGVTPHCRRVGADDFHGTTRPLVCRVVAFVAMRKPSIERAAMTGVRSHERAPSSPTSDPSLPGSMRRTSVVWTRVEVKIQASDAIDAMLSS